MSDKRGEFGWEWHYFDKEHGIGSYEDSKDLWARRATVARDSLASTQAKVEELAKELKSRNELASYLKSDGERLEAERDSLRAQVEGLNSGHIAHALVISWLNSWCGEIHLSDARRESLEERIVKALADTQDGRRLT